MYKPALLLFLGLISTTLPAAAYQIADVDIPDTVNPANSETTLVLNGAGIREKFFMDIYIGALYLPARTTDASEILAASGPASVLMHFLYKEVNKEKITDGWNEGLASNLSSSDMEALQENLKTFNTLFRTVHKGDVINIDYVPGSGAAVRINGEWRGTVEGETFFRSLLKVWLGSHPVTESLKKGMLGTD